MLRRVTLMLTLAAITAVVLTVGAGGAPAQDANRIDCVSGKVCKGTGGNDLIIGSQGNDDINPFGGDDTVYANGGNDNVRHSYGKDTIWGGTGEDTLRGGFGLDTIFGNMLVTDANGNVITDANGKPIDSADNDRDLIDCAYLESRGNTGQDEGFGGDSMDVVVDCSNRDDQ
jgi:Ca2+-binding RTX toxin-like protein